MKRYLWIALMILALVFGMVLSAQALSGEELKMLSETSSDFYIFGVLDETDFMFADPSLVESMHEVYQRIPSEVTRKDMEDVIRKYLASHPEEKDQPAAFVIYDALNAAYPAK